MEGGKDGSGRMEGWKDGRMEGWKEGRREAGGWKRRESEFPPTDEEEKDYGAESRDCLNHGLHRISQITRIRVFGEGKE